MERKKLGTLFHYLALMLMSKNQLGIGVKAWALNGLKIQFIRKTLKLNLWKDLTKRKNIQIFANLILMQSKFIWKK